MIFKQIQPEIKLKEVKRLLGGQNNNQLDDLITTIIRQAKTLIKAIASFKRVSINNKSEVFLFAITIGHELEKEVVNLFKSGNYSQATVLDAVGSAAVEDLRDKLKELAAKLAAKDDLYLGQDYSPGFGPVKLRTQPRIISILAGEKIGLSVNQYNLLEPEKSLTAIIEITARKKSNRTTSCLSCNLKECQYRKELDQCQK